MLETYRKIGLALLAGTTYSRGRRALELARAGYRYLEYPRRLYRWSLTRSYALVYFSFSKHPPWDARQPPPVKAIYVQRGWPDLPPNVVIDNLAKKRSRQAQVCKTP